VAVQGAWVCVKVLHVKSRSIYEGEAGLSRQPACQFSDGT